MTDRELMELLGGVSRSFVLTIRALPGPVRRPVGLAYLLARATDTMADTASAPVEARIECLREFAAALEAGKVEAPGRLGAIVPENVEERRLLEGLAEVAGAARALGTQDWEEIAGLLRKVTRGQELDLVRFGAPGGVRALENAGELEEYTYLVAGCVGEFWTRICAAHLPRYGAGPMEELCGLGRSFGQGLQLVNILRDFPEDVRNGRCYLPMSELREAGIEEAVGLAANLAGAAPVFARWHGKAMALLEEGRRYIVRVRPWRVRYACLLPWALGVQTLRLMEARPPYAGGERVKVTRGDVGRVMRRAMWAAVSNRAVNAWGKTP